LKDYSAFDQTARGTPMGPYQTPNFIFFGDDTERASVQANIARIELIPEPSTLALHTAGLIGGVLRKRRRRNARG